MFFFVNWAFGRGGTIVEDEVNDTLATIPYVTEDPGQMDTAPGPTSYLY